MGACGGKTPVVVVGAAEGPAIGMAVDPDAAGMLVEGRSDPLHSTHKFALWHGGADFEHAVVRLVGDGDEYSFASRYHRDGTIQLGILPKGVGDLAPDLRCKAHRLLGNAILGHLSFLRGQVLR